MPPHVHRVKSERIRQNGYIIGYENRSALLIDPGSNIQEFQNVINENSLKPLAILNTHAHFDHLGGVDFLSKEYKVPFYLDLAEARILKSANIYKKFFDGTENIVIPEVTFDLRDFPDFFDVGDFKIGNIATPGHSPGGRSFLIEGQLFSGDTLFRSTIGRTDLYGGSSSDLAASVLRLMNLPLDTHVRPGHGASCTLDEIRLENKKVLEILSTRSADLANLKFSE